VGPERFLHDRRSICVLERHAFIYVPEKQVLTAAKQMDATPYDLRDVEFTHEGKRCSFDAILRIYDIRDPELDMLADIVRGADTSRHDLTPQCGGLFAISLGLSANFPQLRWSGEAPQCH
jgi:hypothetical protein